MCGIVGFITAKKNGLTSKEADVFQDLLFADTLRGWDSTGVMGRDRFSNVGVLKAAMPGVSFVGTDDFKKFRTQAVMTGSFLIGHNRAATIGVVNDENAHPFTDNEGGERNDAKIVLVQNGTWKGHHKHIKDTEVDTEAVAKILAEEEDIEKALQRVNAAYALVWYNTQTECLHIIRNNERPLHLAYTQDGGIVLSSDMDNLLWACSRNALDLADTPIMLKAGSLGTIKFTGAEWKEDWKDIDHHYRHQTQPFRQHQPAPADNGGGGNDDESDPLAMWHGVNTRDRSFRPQQQHPQSHIGVLEDPRKRVIKDMSQHLFDLDGYHGEPGEEGKLKDMANEYLAKGDGVLVEVVDYLPVNHHKDCQNWYIIGHVFDETLKPDEVAPLVYWMRQGTESEIFEYTTHTWYKAGLGSSTLRYIQDKKNQRKCVITMFAFRCEPVNTAVTVENNNVH